jgi:hypothetical protein
MSYDYRETNEEIIIDKGIATREMWKEYDHGKEHVSFEELCKAVQIRPQVPVVLDTIHDHGQPLTDASKAIGTATLHPCPKKRGLSTIWRLFKDSLPAELLEAIRRREPLPVSIYQFINVDEDGEQHDLLFDHIAILTTDKYTPRCPPERCGVGVYDGKMTEEKIVPEQPKELAEKPAPASPEPVPTEQGGTKAEPPPKLEPVIEAPPPVDKDKLIKELEDKLAKRDAQIAAIRKPLIDELAQRGYQAQELNPLPVTTLEKMVKESRAASTEGLPGTVPAPSPEAPLTPAEAREKEQKRHEESLKRQSAERFKDW